MLRDRSPDVDPDEPAPGDADVISWGDAPPRRRRSFRALDRLREDRRAAPLAVAALGLAAFFGSLVNDWGTVRMRELGAAEFAQEPFHVAASNIGIGSGYLVGVLAILAMTAIALVGVPPLRHNARVAGLAVAGGVLVLLVSATFSMDAVLQRLFPFGSDIEADVRHESGLALAYAATAALGLALHLAGRRPVAERSDDDGAAGRDDDRARPPTRGRRTDESDEPTRAVTVRPAPPLADREWRQP